MAAMASVIVAMVVVTAAMAFAVALVAAAAGANHKVEAECARRDSIFQLRH